MRSRGILIGGGAFAREVLNWAWDCGPGSALPSFEAFLDSEADPLTEFPEFNLTRLGDPTSYVPQDGDIFLIAIGDVNIKKAIVERLLDLKGEFAQLVHPSAVISRTATLGRGTVVGPHAYIATNARVGDFSCVNSLSGIGHDARLGSFCTISSQVDITGKVTLGDGVFAGSGARVLPGIKVAHGCKIGAGAVVVRNTKPGTTLFAQPARNI